MFLIRFCLETLPVSCKKMFMKNEHISVSLVPFQQPPRLCTASFCELSKPLMSWNWVVWLTCQPHPKHGSQQPYPKASGKWSFSCECPSAVSWAHCTGTWPYLTPWTPGQAGLWIRVPWSTHLTASPWCPNCLGGQTGTYPLVPSNSWDTEVS